MAWGEHVGAGYGQARARDGWASCPARPAALPAAAFAHHGRLSHGREPFAALSAASKGDAGRSLSAAAHRRRCRHTRFLSQATLKDKPRFSARGCMAPNAGQGLQLRRGAGLPHAGRLLFGGQTDSYNGSVVAGGRVCPL